MPSTFHLHISEQVEWILRKLRATDKLFGGVQVILVGDPLQLQPVPNLRYGDKGQSVILSPVFAAIKHVIRLSAVHRTEDKMLQKATAELSRGTVQ